MFTHLFVYSLIIAVLGIEPRVLGMLGQLQSPAKIIYSVSTLIVEPSSKGAKESESSMMSHEGWLTKH